MPITLGCLLTALVLLNVAAPGGAGKPKREVSAADFYRADDPTCGIQDAIDSLPAGGGVVHIPPGTYTLRRAVEPRSHVTLRGAGPTTTLRRGRQVSAKLTKPARKGETHVEVDSTAGFRVGDEVGLKDDRMYGWYMGHCVIKKVTPKRLTFVAPITSGHKEGVFQPERHAVVVNYHPFIHARKPVRDVAVIDLAIDGNLKENPGPWQDFTLAAIHFAHVSDVLVRNVVIRGSISDGISVQGGRDARVESCLVERCRSHGLHPGTALRGAVFANNISRNNGGDGLYFCWEVVGITVSGNLLHANQRSGIGGLGEGGKGGDRFNVVTGNVCRGNGRWGIQAVRGRNNVITSNVCIDNSQEKPGRYSGIFLGDTTHTLVSSNRCGADAAKPTQKLGIEEHGKSDANAIVGNICEGNVEGGIRAVGKSSQVSANVGTILRK